MSKRILFVVLFLLLAFPVWGQENNIGVKVASLGLGYEQGYGGNGTHWGLATEVRYIGGIGAGFGAELEGASLYSSEHAKLVMGKHYVDGVRLGFGIIDHDSPLSLVKTGDNEWLTFKDIGFWKLYIEPFLGYEFFPQKWINPYSTVGIGIGGIFYDISPGGILDGIRGNWVVTLPLVAACDFVFYTKKEPDKKYGVIDRYALTPLLRIDIPIYDPKYTVTNGTYDGDELNSWDERFSDWWGLVTIGVSLTVQPFVVPIQDSDHDGVPDKHDECPATPPNTIVDERGCPLPEKREIAEVDLVKELEKKGRVDLHIYFAYDSDEIPPEFYPQLDDLGNALIYEHPDWRLEIAGHTDSIATERYNQKLSERRAKSVRKYLLTHFNIDRNRLIAKGYGESRPTADNGTEEGRALNRRVEFKIIK